MNEKKGNQTSINEKLKILAKKRAAKQQDEDEQDTQIVEPIICNGVADIIVAEEEKER